MPDGQGIGHVVEHIHMRPDGVALENHADAALFGRNKGFAARDQSPVDEYLTRGGLFKARNDAEHGGLSTAGRPEKRDEFAVTEGRVEFTEHHVVSKCFGDVLNVHSCHRSCPFQMENSPFVRRWRMKLMSMTISRMPKAIAQLIGWLVKVQYS